MLKRIAGTFIIAAIWLAIIFFGIWLFWQFADGMNCGI